VVVAKFKEARLLYIFVGAFVVVALAFAVASIVTRSASLEIDRATEDMLTNSLPSVSSLMDARTALRRLEVDAAVLSKPPAEWWPLVDDARNAQQELEEEIRAETETPWYPGEQDLYGREIHPRVARLDRSIGELERAVAADTIAPGEKRRSNAAVARVRADASDLDLGLQALTALNHGQAVAAASRIAATRSNAARLTFLMQLASTVAALAAAAIAVGAARKFGKVALRNLELETSRANELDTLAQRVAHDLMSPLAAVSLSLGGIQRIHSDEETTRSVHRARRALDRSRQLVQGIYQFAGSGGQPAPGARAPLRATVIDAVDDLLSAEGASPPAVDLQSFDEVEVACDRAALGVVVANLLSNAAKFTRDCVERRVSVRAVPGQWRVRVEVEDTGPGVPPGCEVSIFEPYRRAPGVTQPGLGLGLATVKRIVLAYGGSVGVRHAKGGGAVFWFEVPRAPAAPLQEAPPAEEREEVAASGAGPGAVHPVH
jgi:signal transduction histidine kinase